MKSSLCLQATRHSFRWLPALLLGLLCLTPLWAQARAWQIARFDTRITLGDNGTARVDEEIHPRFDGTFHGIVRTLPLDYPGPDGTAFQLHVTVEAVTDENGAPIRFEQSTVHEAIQGGGAHRFLALKIYAGGTDIERTLHIVYRVANAARFFPAYDEFYWNATGLDWKVPIEESSATVVLPPTAAGKFRTKGYTGRFGAKDESDVAITNDGAIATFTTHGELAPREGLTVDVALEKGVLHKPSALTRLGWFLAANPGLLLPLWAFAVMFALWWLKGREPDSGLSVAPIYEAPKGLTPAEAGTLIDDKIDDRDVTSTLIDLAVKGYIKIVEIEEPGLLSKHKDHSLQLLRPRSTWGNELAAHELEVLNNLFPEITSEETTLSDLKNHFYLVLPTIRQQIMGALEAKQLYATDPETAKGLVLVAILVIAFPPLWLQMTGHISLGASPTTLLAGLALTVLIVFFFSRHLAAKTVSGARMKVACLGFKEFLTRVEGDRLRRMPPDTFEKFLPYAMAFGVEQQWAKAFEGIMLDPPSWYVGAAWTPGLVWTPLLFMSSVTDFSSAAYESFTAAPQASASDSGFGDGSSFGGGDGGGYSGGGFGGGGGDAF